MNTPKNYKKCYVSTVYYTDILTGNSVRSLGVAPRNLTGPAGNSDGKVGPPVGGSAPAVPE